MKTSAMLLCLPLVDGILSNHPRVTIRPRETKPVISPRNVPLVVPPSPVEDVTRLGSLTVPSIAIGTIAWTSRDAPELKKVCERASSKGMGFFDTAERYGATGIDVALGMGWGAGEKELKKLLGLGVSEISGAVVATKFTPSPWRTGAASVVAACERSRLNLGVGAIDLYQIHMPDIVQPLARLPGGVPNFKDEQYWDGLAECYHRGLVKNVGVSNYGPTLLRRAHAALAARGVPLASNQINFSLLYRGPASGAQATVDCGRALGVQTLGYMPLAMGLLTGKYTSNNGGGGGGSVIAVENKRSFHESRDLTAYGEAIRPLLSVMRAISKRRGVDLSQVAISWVMCKGVIPVVGCRTVAHVDSAAASLGWRLSSHEVDLLESAADETGVEFKGAGFKRSNEKFVGYGVEKWALD